MGMIVRRSQFNQIWLHKILHGAVSVRDFINIQRSKSKINPVMKRSLSSEANLNLVASDAGDLQSVWQNMDDTMQLTLIYCYARHHTIPHLKLNDDTSQLDVAPWQKGVSPSMGKFGRSKL